MKGLLMAVCMLSLAGPSTTEQDALASVYELFRNSDQDGARRELHELVVRHPSSTELRALYVNLLSRREPERAHELARQLRYARPDDPWSWYAVASAGLLEPSTEHLAEGLEALEKMTALAKEPLPAPMLRLKGTILARLGRLDEARAFLAERDDPAALALMAMVYEEEAVAKEEAAGEQAAHEQADAFYRRARAAAPDDVRIAATYVHFLHERDPAAAAQLAKELIARSPLSLHAHEMYWYTILESRELTVPQKEAAVAEDAAKLLAVRDWPEIYQSLGSWYRRLESAKEAETQRIILERFPWSPEAEYALFRLKTADRTRSNDPEVLAKQRRALQEFIEYPVHFGPYLGTAYSLLLNATRRDPSVSDAELLRVIDGVRAHVTDPMGAKTTVADALAERGLRLEEAEKLAREGVRESPRMIEFERAAYGDQYQRSVDMLTARARATLGMVLLKRNHLVEAGKELQAAVKLFPNDSDVNLKLGRWHEQKKEFTAAELAYARGMVNERAPGTSNLDALRVLYERRKKTAEGFDVYVANLRQAGASDDKRRVLAGRLFPAKAVEQPLTLEDLSGKKVSLADMKGQVAVVNFWGLWCGPCVAEMPDLHKLQQKYAGDPKVRILTVNNDNDPAKVEKWMEKNGYSFPVLVDDGYIRKARVKIFPTTWFVDPDGKIAFEHSGNVANLVDEFSWRIEALKAVSR
jgi:thiol-disulfide isomerase/thioredoxin